MTKKSRQGLRRFRVEVRSWGNYVEQIAELKRVLAKKPRTLQIRNHRHRRDPGGQRVAIPHGVDGTLTEDAGRHECAFHSSGRLVAALVAGRQPDDSRRRATLFSPYHVVRGRRGASEWSSSRRRACVSGLVFDD